jgi:hypothetical protein
MTIQECKIPFTKTGSAKQFFMTPESLAKNELATTAQIRTSIRLNKPPAGKPPKIPKLP